MRSISVLINSSFPIHRFNIRIVIVGTLLFQTLHAQQTLTLHENLVTHEVPSLWNISIATNTPKDYEEVQIKLSLADAGEKVVYEVLSPDIELSSRQVRTLNPSMGIAQTLVNDLPSATLPDGQYEVTYRENKTNRLLKQRQFTVNGEAISFVTLADTGKLDLKKWIATTGTARLTNAFSSPPGLQSEQKPIFSRLEANPTLILGGFIPIAANVLLSTEQNPNGQPMAQAAFNFDANYFRSLLEQKAMSKIESMKPEELSNVEALKEKYMNKKNRHFDEWKEQLVSPEALQQLAQAEAYKKLEGFKDTLEQAIDPQRKQALCDQYQLSSLEELEARKDEIPEKDYEELKFQFEAQATYDEVEAQMANLEDARQKAEKLLAKKAKIEQLENTGYLQMLRDPRFSRSMFKTLGVQNTSTQLLSGLRTLGVGTCFPLYTPLTMNGVRVTGLNVEWNPSLLYMAFTRGSIREQRFDSTANRYEFERKLLAGRLGVGKKNGMHLILSYLKAEDKGNPFISPIDTTTFTPRSNLVMGMDVQLPLFKKRFVTQAEINGSVTNTDNNAPMVPYDGADLGTILDYFDKVDFHLNSSSRFGYAYNLRSELHLFKDNTVISGNSSRVSSNYTSFATPFLMVGQVRHEVKMSQSAWKRRISIGGYYKYYSDNLKPDFKWIERIVGDLDSISPFVQSMLNLPPSKEFSTTLRGFGAEVSISIPKFPSLWAKYLPVTQASNINAVTSPAQAPILASAMSMGGFSWNYRVLKLSCNAQVQVSRYDIQDPVADSDMQMNSITAMNTFAFASGMNCSVSGFYNQASGTGAANQTGVSVSSAAIVKKKIMTGLEIHHLAQGSEDTKTGFTINANYRIMKNISAQLRFTMNAIRSDFWGDRNESYGNLILNVNW